MSTSCSCVAGLCALIFPTVPNAKLQAAGIRFDSSSSSSSSSGSESPGTLPTQSEAAAVADEPVSLEIRQISGSLVGQVTLPTSTTVASLLSQVHKDRRHYAQLLYEGRVLKVSETLGSAGLVDGALLVMVLQKCVWFNAAHSELVELDESCTTAQRKSPESNFQGAVMISEHPVRSFAVKLGERCVKWAGSVELGFATQEMLESLRGESRNTKARCPAYMGNSGGLYVESHARADNDPRYKCNWTEELAQGTVVRIALDDEEDNEGALVQRLSVFVDEELRLDSLGPPLTHDLLYPMISLYGQTQQVEFCD